MNFITEQAMMIQEDSRKMNQVKQTRKEELMKGYDNVFDAAIAHCQQTVIVMKNMNHSSFETKELLDIVSDLLNELDINMNEETEFVAECLQCWGDDFAYDEDYNAIVRCKGFCSEIWIRQCNQWTDDWDQSYYGYDY